MADQEFSFQDLVRKRQSGEFVGRTEPLRLFEQNLTLPPDDPRRRFIFSLSGDAGIGKTSLVRQWERVARRTGYVTGYVDEAALEVPSAIELLASSLAECDVETPTFTSKLAQYRKHRHDVDSDPGAPSGISSLLTRSAVRIGLRAAGDIPVVGAFAGEIDKDEAARQADQARAFLARRFTKHQDVELLLSPVDVLTKAFVTDLRTIGKLRAVALFFDTFERTGLFLNDWLLELLQGRHGNLPPNIVFAISGQRPLDANLWADYLGIRTDVQLEVFTPSEARQLLSSRGIQDSSTVDVILELSGCLPVLVATLAESSAHGPTGFDPTDTAVGRFLKWEPDEDRKTAAKYGALPRRLDREVLAVAAGPDADFDWLRDLPFVVTHVDGYRYHDVVRTSMLRAIRREAPADWTTHHQSLAAHYEARREQLSLVNGKWKDSRWRDLKLEEEYHKLCAVGTSSLAGALSGLIDAYGRSSDATAKWAQMIAQAGRDAGLDDVQARGDQLTAWLQAGDDGELLLLTSLTGDPALDDSHRAAALAERSQVHERFGNYRSALTDLDKAVELDPDVHWIVGWRGSVHAELGHDEQALADLDRAIDLDPTYSWAVIVRAGLHRRRQRYPAALADMCRALELEPGEAGSLAGRGAIYLDMRRLEEAGVDIERALAVEPENTWILGVRGTLLRELGKYDEALADFDRVLDLDPDAVGVRAERAATLRDLERNAEALAELDRALEQDPGYLWAHGLRSDLYISYLGDPDRAVREFEPLLAAEPDNPDVLFRRGDTYRVAQRFDEALSALDRAIELDPDHAFAIGTRGQVHQEAGRDAEARADFDRGIELNPYAAWMWVHRAQIAQDEARYDDALADLDHAIELTPLSGWAYGNRGSVHQDADDLTSALDDYDRAVELDPGFRMPLGYRGQLHRRFGRYTRALADLDNYLTLAPDNAWGLSERGIAHHLAGHDAAALADHNRAVELSPDNLLIRGDRADFLRLSGRYDDALADLALIIEAAPEDAWGYVARGETYRAIGADTEATADFERSLELEPARGWSRYQLGLIALHRGETAAAESAFRAALTDQRDEDRDEFNRALYLLAAGRPDAAGRQFEQLLAADPLPELVRDAIDDLRDLGTVIGADHVADTVRVLTTYWDTLEH